MSISLRRDGDAGCQNFYGRYEHLNEEKETTVIANQIFYSNPFDCQQAFRSLSCFKKMQSSLISYASFYSYWARDYKFKRSTLQHIIEPLTSLDITESAKNKLVVLIAGLNSSPYTFKELVNESRKKDLKGLHIYIPKVLNQGNASLDEATMPIFEKIKSWAQLGGQDLTIVGESNGARIAFAIDAEISKPENRGKLESLKIVSIGGAVKGSKVANIANSLYLSCLINDNIRNEMPTDSYRTKKLYEDWHNAVSTYSGIKRQYTLIAASDDWLVPDFESTLLSVPKGMGRYAIILNHGHVSLTEASASIVSEIIFA